MAIPGGPITLLSHISRPEKQLGRIGFPEEIRNWLAERQFWAPTRVAALACVLARQRATIDQILIWRSSNNLLHPGSVTLMKDLAMIPGSRDAGRDAMLTLPRVVRRSTSLAVALFAVMHRVARFLSVRQRQAMGRRTFAKFDDYLLRDIGLTRADVQEVLMKPFWWA